jgi:hypothetical protein
MTMDDDTVQKSSNKYVCEKCDFNCSRLSQYNRHLYTRKHIQNDNIVTLSTNLVPKSSTRFQCECGNIYRYRQGLHKHRQTCSTNETECKQTTPIIPIDHAMLTEKMIELVMSKNQEFMNMFMEKIVHIAPSITNTNTTNNTTNNQFNIQMFLNEHCKNAMNLTDFIDSLPITAATYDSTIENGLTKTITNMITSGLNKLDILERPIHCTDATRKTLYIKEADIWEKDTELLKVVEGIKTLIRKKRTLISRWKEANRGWDTVESKQMRFTELICNIMTDVDFDEKETGKIVRSISKSVYLDNEDKKKYLC